MAGRLVVGIRVVGWRVAGFLVGDVGRRVVGLKVGEVGRCVDGLRVVGFADGLVIVGLVGLAVSASPPTPAKAFKIDRRKRFVGAFK